MIGLSGFSLDAKWIDTSIDPWKDESGKGHWRSGDYGWSEPERKFKFRSADGCEVERKWKKGEYEEKVKCKPGRCGMDTDTLIELCPIARLPNNRDL